MKITIFNPAPLGETQAMWGDYHFGRALQRGLEALGALVTQRYWPEWNQDEDADVHLVLRGKRAFPEAHRRPAILWMVSHPSSASEAEFSAYDFVLLGSKRHQALLGDFIRTGEFDVARQCTEFMPPGRDTAAVDTSGARRGIIFVANSRRVRRPILHRALELGIPVELYGRDWDTFGLGKRVHSEYVANEQLAPLYRQSRLALNDHWTDMQYFGYINNRIFDCMASGLPVITDEFAELHEVFGANLLYAGDRTGLLESYGRYLQDYAALEAQTDACWRRIGADYTFDARARLIADIAQRIRARSRPGTQGAAPRPVPGQSDLAGLLPGSAGEHVLHVAPSRHLGSTGELDDRVGYVTAGLGCGPWTVAIDEQLSAFAPRSFNLIIVDDISGHELADALDSRVFVEALRKCLRKNGRILAHDNSSLVREARPGWAPGSVERVSTSYLELGSADTAQSAVPVASCE